MKEKFKDLESIEGRNGYSIESESPVGKSPMEVKFVLEKEEGGEGKFLLEIESRGVSVFEFSMPVGDVSEKGSIEGLVEYDCLAFNVEGAPGEHIVYGVNYKDKGLEVVLYDDKTKVEEVVDVIEWEDAA